MRRGPHLLVTWAMVAAVAVAPAGAAAAQSRTTESVSAKDDFFDTDVVRVPVGTTVAWTNEGRSPHNVTTARWRRRAGERTSGARRFAIRGSSWVVTIPCTRTT